MVMIDQHVELFDMIGRRKVFGLTKNSHFIHVVKDDCTSEPCSWCGYPITVTFKEVKIIRPDGKYCKRCIRVMRDE